MLWYEALDEICVGVNDPDLKLFENAKVHFLTALAGFIKSGEYTLEEIFGLHKTAVLTFSSGEEDISALKVEIIRNLYADPTGASKKNVVFMPTDKALKINTSGALLPGINDIYIYKIGGILYSITIDDVDPTGTKMEYIEYPDDSGWNDSSASGTGTDLETVFSLPYIKRAIIVAMQGLTIEDQDFKG